MPRSTSSAEIMISNSRLISSNAALGLAPQPNDRVTDSYSNSLMDDLFGDVDRVLEGDLDDCEAKSNPHFDPAASTVRTVQLPSHISPRSAADLYQAAMAADRTTSSLPPTSSKPGLSTPVSSLTGDKSAEPQSAYQAGGRPVTTAHQLGQSLAGNLQSSVIQSPIYSSAGSSSNQGASTDSIEIEPPVQSVSNSLYPPAADLELSSSETSPRPLQTIFEPKRWRVSLAFLVLGASGVALVGALGLWTARATSNEVLPVNSDAANPAATSDADFLAYLQNALETISASQRVGAQTVAVMPVAAPTGLPTIPTATAADVASALPKLPGVATQTPNTPNIIERVFVPIYQNGRSQNGSSANSTPGRATAALPPIALASANSTRRRPTVPVPGSTAALPSTAPATGISSIPVVPAGSGSLPSPGVDLAAGSAVGSMSGLTDVTPASELVLVGVLNLGDRSAALFDIDGSSQRAYVGDRIGLSNWTLASVNGQDVVIRRNDEVRSVYIGQRF
ncbi:hypothetical protein [cf. Phormidesmis sp. LEGE 11477]|uniref:hypothetical protein n=1 Tax=cf. Phormidesmis sp. LEGE 11477 TaxID=1828680 RepID=UPI0018825575|nr:hypothetical protein [cf. Phormidesmis sp. LEGE 11477]MBE9062436.1 hypothetical protein [cf. Phormidesmis sp. LEGE 11477]